MVDEKERYERIFSFMKRNAHVAGLERHIIWVTQYLPDCYTDADKEKAYAQLEEAKALQKELADKVFEEMQKGIVNTTTQGIWLSYNKGFERLEDLPDKSRRYIMTLETGEKFLTERKRIGPFSGCSNFLDKMKIIKKL